MTETPENITAACNMYDQLKTGSFYDNQTNARFLKPAETLDLISNPSISNES